MIPFVSYDDTSNQQYSPFLKNVQCANNSTDDLKAVVHSIARLIFDSWQSSRHRRADGDGGFAIFCLKPKYWTALKCLSDEGAGKKKCQGITRFIITIPPEGNL